MNRPIPQPSGFAPELFPTEVWLVRHGESASYVPGDPSEFTDPPLSDLGVSQAKALAERLAGAHLDAVYASDLARAIDTARPLAAPRGLEVGVDPDLREVHLGEWENGGFRRRAAERDEEFLAWAATGRWEAIPGAERDDDLRARVRGSVERIAAAHHGGRVAVVCHSGVVNAWLAAQWESYRSMVATIDNTSVTRLRGGAGHWLVLAVNDRHHLGDPLV